MRLQIDNKLNLFKMISSVILSIIALWILPILLGVLDTKFNFSLIITSAIFIFSMFVLFVSGLKNISLYETLEWFFR